MTVNVNQTFGTLLLTFQEIEMLAFLINLTICFFPNLRTIIKIMDLMIQRIRIDLLRNHLHLSPTLNSRVKYETNLVIQLSIVATGMTLIVQPPFLQIILNVSL